MAMKTKEYITNKSKEAIDTTIASVLTGLMLWWVFSKKRK